MARMDHTVLSSPLPSPVSNRVAGPVFAEYAISLTAARSGWVNNSVSLPITTARPMPTSVARPNRHPRSPVTGSRRYTRLTSPKPTAEIPAAVQNPILIGCIGSPIASSLPRTTQVPTSEAKTPMARTSNG